MANIKIVLTEEQMAGVREMRHDLNPGQISRRIGLNGSIKPVQDYLDELRKADPNYSQIFDWSLFKKSDVLFFFSCNYNH